jgi:hypothetical protein
MIDYEHRFDGSNHDDPVCVERVAVAAAAGEPVRSERLGAGRPRVLLR